LNKNIVHESYTSPLSTPHEFNMAGNILSEIYYSESQMYPQHYRTWTSFLWLMWMQ